MYRFIAIIMFSWLFNIISAQNEVKLSLQTGDILFCANDQGELSKAIDKVTKTASKTNFSHMGIVSCEGNNTYVFHAAPKLGVCKQSLSEFFNGEYAHISVYRLKSEWKSSIPEAVNLLPKLIGEKYDYTYILESEGFYCSELIAHIFESDSIFKYEPMTFKNPDSGEYNTTWKEHYKKLGIEIPEGKPGCNPNGMAASEKLEYIGRIK